MSRRRSSLRITNNLGMMLLAAWLVLTGLIVYLPSVRSAAPLMPLLALGAGLLILLGH